MHHPVTPPITSWVATLYFSADGPDSCPNSLRHHGCFLVNSARSSASNFPSKFPWPDPRTPARKVSALPYPGAIEAPWGGRNPASDSACNQQYFTLSDKVPSEDTTLVQWNCPGTIFRVICSVCCIQTQDFFLECQHLFHSTPPSCIKRLCL